MNEYGILIYLLTRTRKFDDNPQLMHIGSTEEELITALGFTGKNAKNEYLKILQQFNNLIGPLSLIIRQNPFTRYWFLSVKSEIQEFFAESGFLTKKSAATLATILILCLSQEGAVTIQDIQVHRNKVDITDDLSELISHYMIIQEGTTIKIHPALAYYLDINQFIGFLDKISSEPTLSPNDNITV